jgi:hypothetical protein
LKALEAKWFHAPRVAWIIVSAFGPAKPIWIRIPVLVLAFPAVTAILVMRVAAEGLTIYSSAHAVLLLAHRRRRWWAIRWLVIVVVLSVFFVVLLARLGIDVFIGLAVLALLTGAAGLISLGDRRAYLQLQKELKGVADEYAVVSTLAAWPQRQGHATDLIHAMMRSGGSSSVPVYAAARTDGLAAWYQKFGMVPVSPESPLVLVWWPGTDPQPS